MAFDKSVLFVCLGNICRSPMAEAILKDKVKRRSDSAEWKIDSCRTGDWHVGNQPHERTLETLADHEIKNFKHHARQLRKKDYSDFKWIFVFDRSNLADVTSMKPKSSNSTVKLLRVYDPSKESDSPTVADPWYDGDEYFEVCFEQCTRSVDKFLEEEFSN